MNEKVDLLLGSPYPIVHISWSLVFRDDKVRTEAVRSNDWTGRSYYFSSNFKYVFNNIKNIRLHDFHQYIC